MLKKILITVIALSFLLPTYVSAATYFVAPNGNDSNSGTQQQPFKTIQKGVNKLSPGDTLNIRGGTYVEQVNITKGGTAQNPVTIQAYQNEQVTIDGEYRLPGGGLPAKMTLALQRGVITPRSDGNYNYVGAGAGQLENPIVYDISTGILVDIKASNILMRNIDIKRSKGRSVRNLYNQNVILDNVNIRNSRDHSFSDYGTNNTIKNCEITDSQNFAPFTRPASTAQLDTSGINWGAAIPQTSQNSDESVGLTVQNCIVHDNWGEGIMANVDTTIENNIVYNNFSASIYMENSKNAIIRNNLVYNTGETILRNGKRAIGINVTDEPWGGRTTSGGQIYNNIILGNGTGFVTFNGNISNIDFYNNTIVNISESGRSIIISSNASLSNYSVRNNIFYTGLFNDLSTITNTQVLFKSNIWNKRPENIALNGSNNNSVVADPLLVNPNALISILRSNQAINPANYGPKANSPARGLATGAIPQRDFFGCLRDNDPDAGAIEYGGTNCNRDVIPTPNEPTPTTQEPTPTVSEPTPTPSVTPLNKYDVTENGVVDILDIIEVIKYVFGS